MISKLKWHDASVEKPIFYRPVLVKCGNTHYRMEMLKYTIASWYNKEEILECSEFDDIEANEIEDSWLAETGLFDQDGFGGRLMQEEVTEWAYLNGEDEE